MMHKLTRSPLFILLAIFTGFNLFAGATPVSAALQVTEGGLATEAESGDAYEINADAFGQLWISDFGAGQIWSIDPVMGITTKYKLDVSKSPSDARRVGNYFYWADALLGELVRSNLNGEMSIWNVPGATGFFGTAVDAQNRLWATGANDPVLYRLDPTNSQLCEYDVPFVGATYYLAYQDGYLWFSDEYFDGTFASHTLLIRVAVINNGFEMWELEGDSSPLGMSVDAEGDLWYADPGRNEIAELDPDTDIRRSFHLPKGVSPAMVAIHDGLIWYTEDGQHTFGMLDPTVANYTSTNFTGTPGQLNQKGPCTTNFKPGPPVQITQDTGSSGTWPPQSYPALQEAGGWQIYNIPEASSIPWGIAAQGGNIWVVDRGRQVLIRAPLQASLLACKSYDRNNNSTPDDRSPVAGWAMTLFKDNVDVGTLLTGTDGCARWDGLVLGSTYRVIEESRPGWQPLEGYPTECTLGPFSKPGLYSCSFVNWADLQDVFLPVILR